jgi:hypothetical protein
MDAFAKKFSRDWAKKAVAFAILSWASILSGCGEGNRYSCDSETGRRAIISEVDQALSREACAEAIALVETYYPQPGCASDEMRLARASANACAANVNFLRIVNDLAGSNLSGNAIWVTLTELFPSNPVDQRVIGGQNALDALFAIRKPGVLTPPSYVVNASSANPGTLLASHRTEESNLNAMLVSMSLIGSLQNRFGAPLPNHHRGQKLGRSALYPNGWEDPLAVDVNACTYVGAILTLFDSIEQVAPVINGGIGGSAGTQLVAAASAFSSLVGQACDIGCVACGMPAGSCTTCPIELRDRNSCTGQTTDRATCSAAGIIRFMNSDAAGMGWPD